MPFEVAQVRGVLAERVVVSTILDPWLPLKALTQYSGLSRKTLLPRDPVMRPPRFPLDRTGTYSVVRGIVLFFHHGSWRLRYRRRGRKLEESLGTQDDWLAWAELQKASKLILEGVTPQELIGASHHATMTVAEAAKEFLARYAEIALGTQRKLR